MKPPSPQRGAGDRDPARPRSTPHELAWLRRLGVTKVQMGAQSLDDRILALNQRGHTVADTHAGRGTAAGGRFQDRAALDAQPAGRHAGFGPADFARLWDDLCPDEIKIYPTQLLANAELYEYWQRGEYPPYTTEELIELIADIKPTIPRYCRVNRVIRDIPSTNVVEGNKRTSLRQDVQQELRDRGTRCQCIRCREVRQQVVETEALATGGSGIPGWRGGRALPVLCDPERQSGRLSAVISTGRVTACDGTG